MVLFSLGVRHGAYCLGTRRDGCTAVASFSSYGAVRQEVVVLGGEVLAGASTVVVSS